ncbi:MAG: nucleoside deaminase [Magnetococcales bacterium]|nr:nucleoside deaminase [Magnetococcales bacterium]
MCHYLSDDQAAMTLALVQAAQSGAEGEIPVGAVVRDRLGRFLAEAGNRAVADHDPTGHAEIRALRMAAGRIGNYRLTNCTMSVTLEPCPMCRHAIGEARIARVTHAAPRLAELHQGLSRPPESAALNPLPAPDMAAPNAPHQPLDETPSRHLSALAENLLRFFFVEKRKT